MAVRWYSVTRNISSRANGDGEVDRPPTGSATCSEAAGLDVTRRPRPARGELPHHGRRAARPRGTRPHRPRGRSGPRRPPVARRSPVRTHAAAAWRGCGARPYPLGGMRQLQHEHHLIRHVYVRERPRTVRVAHDGPRTRRRCPRRRAVVLAASWPWRSPAQALSLSRPLRRRALMISRPARVRMRSRNPCLRERRRLFGWNVRFMGRASLQGPSGTRRAAAGRGRDFPMRPRRCRGYGSDRGSLWPAVTERQAVPRRARPTRRRAHADSTALPAFRPQMTGIPACGRAIARSPSDSAHCGKLLAPASPGGLWSRLARHRLLPQRTAARTAPRPGLPHGLVSDRNDRRSSTDCGNTCGQVGPSCTMVAPCP